MPLYSLNLCKDFVSDILLELRIKNMALQNLKTLHLKVSDFSFKETTMVCLNSYLP